MAHAISVVRAAVFLSPTTKSEEGRGQSSAKQGLVARHAQIRGARHRSRRHVAARQGIITGQRPDKRKLAGTYLTAARCPTA